MTLPFSNSKKTPLSGNPQVRRGYATARNRGAAAILAMMFLVIFASLATAMAIVAQGNLSTADSHLKINRTLATAETGLNFILYRLNLITANVKTSSGVIDTTNADDLWDTTRQALLASLSNELHNIGEPYETGTALHVGPIAVEPLVLQANQPAPPGLMTFTATLTPHPIAGENYDSAYYQRPPYNTMEVPVSNADPLDSTWIRLRVEAYDGPAAHRITRAIQVDLRMEKKIKFALLSRSRIMIGKNVMIQGPVGSRFTETNLANGHPVQMESDFVGLDANLDTKLNQFVTTLETNDKNGDNRLALASASEMDGIDDPEQYDTDGDGYITDYDFFMSHYDTDAKGFLTATDLNTVNNIRTAQLLQLIDTFGDPSREGYNDGIIDENDLYTKIHGQILLSAAMNDWQAGAANGPYQQYFQGGITSDGEDVPLIFEADENNVPQFSPGDFDTSTLKAVCTSDLATQAAAEAAKYDPSNPNSPKPLGTTAFESVPYGSAHPYDYYTRPVYENMTFTNVKIPKGSNALFKNCKFIGCTFVETAANNTDPNYNYAGMQEADGSQKYPSMTATVDGVTVNDTKTSGNNVRFDGCTFEGAVVSDVPTEFTQVRNKITFTGKTAFNIDNSTNLTSTEKALYRRSTILAPQYSVEMGTFINPSDPSETVNLTGTIVTGIADMRGQIKIEGTMLTTFEPISNTGPVIGQTSPQYNTTLGYFSSATGDMEAELPNNGLGLIQMRYNPTIPLPDGILGPISLTPSYSSWTETGAQQ